MSDIFEKVKFNIDGLIPAVTQDIRTDEVLMLAYMNEESLRKTMETGMVHYYSRSRQKLWLKGETSGHFQKVRSISVDCDGDTLLIKVEQTGAACHTGHHSCFFTKLDAEELKSRAMQEPGTGDSMKDAITVKADEEKDGNSSGQSFASAEQDEKNTGDFGTSGPVVLQEVYDVISDRLAHPREGSYTNYLFTKGIDKILKKVGEEACEVVIAAKNGSRDDIKAEIADLMYHIMVLLVERGMTLEDVYEELEQRK